MPNPIPHSHCHACGARHTQNDWPKTCPECREQIWINPMPVAALLQPVIDKGRRGVLIGLRGIEPQRNHWGLIGGFGETSDDGAEAGMKREKTEETRLKNDPEVRLMFSGGSGPLDQPHKRQWLIFGYAKRPISADAISGFKPDEETLALEIAFEPRELAFPLHTRALSEFFSTYHSEVDWDNVEAA